ncbi:hypothetical protein HanRHA438_Chr10g0461141 [Helianthus annuus]|uniref:Uncharacterized protein n=1 Tax=Helianthus annuus TaxID=4232 RepID=A0A9K3HYU4_HELAN|nr:hypothetical protein HanXRQr2_Chr10g0448591 [Helianthus annuus]KAJ0880260.1 hypothetical protein HanRHA438_Chr10g0461141 [Helianthus annuus]KAJ0884372.1 hypothetical protein HanPSC8_Chr10g0432941 [Helianthus annuus]
MSINTSVSIPFASLCFDVLQTNKINSCFDVSCLHILNRLTQLTGGCQLRPLNRDEPS